MAEMTEARDSKHQDAVESVIAASEAGATAGNVSETVNGPVNGDTTDHETQQQQQQQEESEHAVTAVATTRSSPQTIQSALQNETTAVPAKVPRPNPAAKDAQLQQSEARIKELEQIREIARDKLEKLMAASAGSRNARKAIHDSMDDQRKLQGELTNARDKLQVQLNACIDDLKGLKSVGSQYMSSSSNACLDAQVAELEHQQETTLPLSEANALVDEISNLKIIQNDAERNEIEKLRLENEKEELVSQLDELRVKIDQMYKNTKATRDQLEALDTKFGIYGGDKSFGDLRKDRDAANKNIEIELKRKRAVLMAWKIKNNKYYEYKRWETTQRHLEKEIEKTRRITEIKERFELWEAEETRGKPCLEEVVLCNVLLGYVDKLADADNIKKNDENNKDEPNMMSSNVENIQRGEKSDDKKQATFVHPKELIEWFNRLSVSVPTRSEDLVKCKAELVGKHEYYFGLPWAFRSGSNAAAHKGGVTTE